MAEEAATENYPASPVSTADGRIPTERPSEASQFESRSAGEDAQHETRPSDQEPGKSPADTEHESPSSSVHGTTQSTGASDDAGPSSERPFAGETSEDATARGEGLSESAPQGESEEQEEEECGFCLFMKGGPCKQRFTSWQDCVEGAEKSDKDIVQQCAQMTSLLRVCMEMNPDYYGPVLEAEKAMEAEVNSMEQNPETSGTPQEAEVNSEKSSTETGVKPTETPAGGGEEAAYSASGEVTIQAVEEIDIVLDDKGEVKEVVDNVKLKETPG